MTSSLRTRVAALCAIVAMLTAALGLWASSRILVRVLEAHVHNHAREALVDVTAAERRLIGHLSYEVGDYARWDELYQQMPNPSAQWARDNLSPGSFRGAVNRGMAIFSEGRWLGNFATGTEDPIPAPDRWHAMGDLTALSTAPPGLALIDGRVAMQANDAIVRSDLSGPPRGRLLAYRAVDAELLMQLTPHGWTLKIAPAEIGAALMSPVITSEQNRLTMTEVRAVPGGAIRMTLQAQDNFFDELQRPVIHGMIAVGLLSVLLATLLGMLLGWHWMDPLRRLAHACQRRASGETTALPNGSGLLETESLAEEVNKLITGERQTRTELQAALERMRTAHAVHSRFSEGLVVDLTEPLRRLGAVLETNRTGQLIDAAALIEAQEALARIADRLADGAALGQDSRAGRPGPVLVELASWLDTMTHALLAFATQRQVRLETRCEPGEVRLDIRQLMPLMVHLLSNAIRAAPPASTVQVRADFRGGYLHIAVHDHGAGFQPAVLERVRAACARGEVLSGEPGIGFGLSLVIERSAQLGGYLAIPTSDSQGTIVCLAIPAGARPGMEFRPQTS